MKLSKREIILESIIKEYLKSKEPIGSSELQGRMSINISPSTIRIYFKQISLEGALVQLHVSSGRVPTQKALINYWASKLEPQSPIAIYDIDKVQDSIRNYGIYCTINKSKNPTFNELMEVGNRFLILVFDDEEVIIKYHPKIKLFLENLIGSSMKDLKNISSSVGLYELHNKLESIFTQSALLQEGKNELYKIAKEIEDDNFIQKVVQTQFLDTLDNGMYFDDFVPKGCIAVKQHVTIDKDELEMFCLGKLDRDFESFFNQAKE
ncbi:MAG: HrcA family transcriptional regulator [Campylobacteraceae bacterium]|nr:HrcA family transcriptional regulator [Campylobacteraceae bacterium]